MQLITAARCTGKSSYCRMLASSLTHYDFMGVKVNKTYIVKPHKQKEDLAITPDHVLSTTFRKDPKDTFILEEPWIYGEGKFSRLIEILGDSVILIIGTPEPGGEVTKFYKDNLDSVIRWSRLGDPGQAYLGMHERLYDSEWLGNIEEKL